MAEPHDSDGGELPAPISSSGPPVYPDASLFVHTPFYCEENVYLLCKRLITLEFASALDLFVVFISNENKMVPLWHQKASQSHDGLVLWDYHVICIQTRRSNGSSLDIVWDLDSDLPIPSPVLQYMSEAIRLVSFDHPIYKRLFRVVHAPIFLRSFASDRSHMKNTSGEWIKPPPPYEPIVAEGIVWIIVKELMIVDLPVMTGSESLSRSFLPNASQSGSIVGITKHAPRVSRLPPFELTTWLC